MTDIPRRVRLDLFTSAERAIYDAVQAVEAMAADVRLTDAVILLQAARDSVADYVDNLWPHRRCVSTTPFPSPVERGNTMTPEGDPALLPVAEAPPQDDIDRKICDLQRFGKGFTGIYPNRVYVTLDEVLLIVRAASCAPRTPDEKGHP